ncbi:QueT transporter family protein [Candidatus Clostridium radicumherbarum]|uniref:QueT transporter family protein n=1 Tax=Candidatus Clostridium radicumherbarum TaxID=3381662 RepID=A0ABW8TR67_9CLOT
MINKQNLASNYTLTRKLTLSGLVMALYIIIMYYTQSFSFGQYQIRLATSLYSLSYIFPFLILPLGLSNMLSNILMGGFGIPDMLGGLAVGIITSTSIYLIKKFNLNEWLIAIPIIIFPGLVVPIWLSFFLKLPYSVLAVSITIGQIIPSIIGILLIKRFKKVFR